MIKQAVRKWDANKHNLEHYFRTTKQLEYSNYVDIVMKVFDLVINVGEMEVDEYVYATDKMTVIDDGHYQGTQIFIIPRDTYQPDVDDYIMTDTYYGSCSGCDTLQAIPDFGWEFPSEEQVKEYMTLALHLIQKLRPLQ